MSWILLGGQVLLLWLKRWLTRDAEKREIRKEALNDVKKAIKEKDVSKITAAFDRVNRH